MLSAMRLPRLLLALVCCLLLSVPASAQAGRTEAGSTVASCGDARTTVTIAQTLGINLVINRVDAWVFGWDFSDVDFGSWSRNLELGWQWDESQFGVNMFAHPYHGSLYFAAARANCHSYWQSIPITFLGSWMWEFFGERYRPSLNDFWMTGLGGAALGEILHRASTAIIDTEMSGGERIAREFAATLVNPIGGLNRLLRGQWNDVVPNLPDRLPESYSFMVRFGGRGIREVDAPEDPSFSPTVLLDAGLGDTFDSEFRAPFDVVRMRAQVSPDGGGLNLMRVLGRLYATDLTDAGASHRHQLRVDQRFDYINNPVYRFGEQSVELGVYSRWSGPFDLRLGTRVAGAVVMLGAIDALSAGVVRQRSIDYGPGMGAILEVTVGHGRTTYLTLYNRVRQLWTVSGAPARHTILFTGLDLSIPVNDRLGLGAYISADGRQSDYDALPNDDRSYVETRIFLTWRVAGLLGSGVG